jgi:hypothetical protein
MLGVQMRMLHSISARFILLCIASIILLAAAQKDADGICRLIGYMFLSRCLSLEAA